MKFRHCLLLLSLLGPSPDFTVWGQSPSRSLDSLSRLLGTSLTDTSRLRLLNELANRNFNIDTRRSMAYAEQAAHLARNLNDQPAEAQAYYRIAANHRAVGKFPLATQLALKSLRLGEKLGLQTEVAHAYTLLGHIAWDGEGDNAKAMRYFEKALGLIRAAGDSAELPSLYNHIGLMHKDAGNLPKAISYIRQAAGIVSRQPADNQRELSAFYNNLSKIALMQNNFRASFYWVDQAMLVNVRFNNRLSQTFSLENVARTHAAMGNAEKAEKYFQKSLSLAKSIKADNRVRSVYKSRSEAYEWLGDYRSALAYYKKFDLKKDSLINERTNQQMAELQTQYETGRKEERIQQLDAENRLNRQQMTYLGGGTLVLLALLGGLAWQYRRIRTSREQIQAQSAQMRTLMKELHHRVKNNLAIVSSLLNLQAYQLDDERAIKAVREGQHRVEAMSLIHQRLYQTDTLTRIDVRAYLTDLAESLMRAYGYSHDDFNLDLRVEEEWLDVDVAIPLGLIVNELVTNAFKYAYQRVDDPSLQISLTNHDGLTLDVADNGPGLDLSRWHTPEGSFGKQLIQSLGEQLGGQLSLETRQGTHFTLRIPETAKAA